MCVMHRLCVVCYCLCFLISSSRSDEDTSLNHLSNFTQTKTGKPRDQHVKNVSGHHEHIHDGIGTQGNDSLGHGVYFVKKIFEKFGEEDELTIVSLKKLFHELKLLAPDINNAHDHSHVSDSENHDHKDGNIKHTSDTATEHNHDQAHDHDHDNNHDHDHGEEVDHLKHANHTEKFQNGSSSFKTGSHESKKLDNIGEKKHKRAVTSHLEKDHTDCLDLRSLLDLYHLANAKSFNVEQFLHISPALIYQLDNPKCHDTEHPAHDPDVDAVGFSGIPAAVWGYSTLAVVIISLVGLLGVAVIPIMQKVFYNHLLQFLIALAVGTLTGDALLHLLPHAIIGHQLHNHDNHGTESLHSDNMHKSAVFKGVCGLAGMFFFFLMERTLTIVTDIKRKRKQNTRKTLSPRQKTVCKDDRSHIAKKLSAYDESDYQSCEEMVMVVHPNKSLKGFADETHHKVFHTSHDSCRPKEEEHSHSSPKSAEEEGMLSALPHSHSGHSHHRHCEMLSNSVASIAWMVILGDGIHNFSDGLAIGAAFANSITGGFSTAVAVFCHELPHEIGDFAVLLRAGMSVKQAVVYNCVSSLLCFVGMLIGVAIGNISEASEWIFACVAGMFIYIATVDMLPEMTSVDTKQGEHPFCHLFLQCIGMLLGAGIMLIIAFYEEELLVVLGG